MAARDCPRRTVLALCCAGMANLSFMVAGPAIWLTEIGAELGMNQAQKGLFLSAPSWGLLAAMLLAGPAADRRGFRPPLLLGVALQALGLALVGLAPGRAWALLGGCVLGVGSGLGDALFTPIACGLYPRDRARVANLLHAFYPIGLIATVLLLLALGHAGWTWRRAFLLLAILPLPVGLAVGVVPFPAASHEGPQRMAVRRFLGRGAYLAFLVAILLACATEVGPAGWLPSFIEELAGSGRVGGGVALVLFGVAMGVGRLGASAAVPRLGSRRLLTVGGVASAGCLVLAACSAQPWSRVLWLTLLGLSVAALWPTIMGCAGDRFPGAGATMYAVLAAAGALGGIVGPVAIGVVAQWLGLPVAMGAMAVAPLVMALLLARVVAVRVRAGGGPGDRS